MLFRSRGVYVAAIAVIWVLIVMVPFLSKHIRNSGTSELQGEDNSGSGKSQASDTESASTGATTQLSEKTDGKEASTEPDNLKEGDIRQGNACLDNMERSEGGQAGTYQCHGEGGNQYWFLTSKHMLRNKEFCLEAPKISADGPVLLRKCNHEKHEQRWEFEADMFISSGSKQCLDSSGTDGVVLKKCDAGSVTQRWKF